MTRIWFWTFVLFLAAVVVRAVFAFLGGSANVFVSDFIFCSVVLALIINVQIKINKWADDLDSRAINSTYREQNLKLEIDRIVKVLEEMKQRAFEAGGHSNPEIFFGLDNIACKFDSTREWLEKDHVRTSKVLVPVPAMYKTEQLPEPSDASETYQGENGDGKTRKPIREILAEVYDGDEPKKEDPRIAKLRKAFKQMPRGRVVPVPPVICKPELIPDDKPERFEIKTNNILWKE